MLRQTPWPIVFNSKIARNSAFIYEGKWRKDLVPSGDIATPSVLFFLVLTARNTLTGAETTRIENLNTTPLIY